MSLKKETRILYGTMLILQTVFSIFLYFKTLFYLTIILSIIMILLLPVLTHYVCLKLKSIIGLDEI